MHFFPEIIIPFLEVFRNEFNQAGFQYFLGFLWGFVCTPGKKTLTNIASGSPIILRHPSCWSRFLACGQWDVLSLQKKMWRLILEYLPGKVFYMGYIVAVIDTTLVPIFGKKMMGVQKWHDHSGNADRGDSIRGHHWGLVGVLIRSTRWLCFPICARLLSGKINPGFIAGKEGVKVADFWEQTLGLCRQLKRIVCWPMIIIADAYFSKAPFIKGLSEEQIIQIGRLRSDAKGWQAHTPQKEKRRGRPRTKGLEIRIKDLLKKLPVQEACVEKYGKIQNVSFVSQILHLRNVSFPVLVVIVKTKKAHLILFSTSTKLNPVTVIELYAARFSIETAIQIAKGKLGVMDYQFVTPVSIYRYVNLVLLTLCFWQTIALAIPVNGWIEGFKKKVYLLHTDISFGLIAQVLRQFAVRKTIFEKFPKHKDFQKIRNTCSDIERLAA